MKPLTLNASQKTKKTPIGEIPVEWEVRRLYEVARVQTGVAKGRKGLRDPVSLPYLRVANVQEGHLDLSEVKTIAIERTEILRFGLRNNDVLLTEGGDIDKLGRGYVWHGQINPCLHQNHIFVVRPDCEILSPLFFSMQIAGIHGRRYFLGCAKQTTNLASINSTQLKDFPVILPPISEQGHITKVLGIWDTGIGRMANILAAKRQLKTGLMQQLLNGKRTAKERKWHHLGELFDERVEIGRSDLPLLSITGDRGIVNRDDLGKKDTSNADKRKYLRIVPGDIGYNTMRMWQGVSALSDLEGIISPAYTVCIPKRDKIDGKFAAYLFKHQPVVHRFWSYSQGMVDDTLNLKFHNFAQVRVEIPSLETQREIATILSGCDREIALLEDKLDCLREQKKGLMQKLLTGKIRVKV